MVRVHFGPPCDVPQSSGRPGFEEHHQDVPWKLNNNCEPWILGELLTMGNVNMVYRNLKADKIRKHISHYFGLQPIVLESWITSLTLLRNACCHHSRVWNKVSSIMPVSPRRIAHSWITLPSNPQRVYFTICIIKYFLDIISPNNDMLGKVQTLFSNYPEIDLTALGFPNGWESEPLWLSVQNPWFSSAWFCRILMSISSMVKWVTPLGVR